MQVASQIPGAVNPSNISVEIIEIKPKMRQKDGLSDYSLIIWYPKNQLIIILPIHIMQHFGVSQIVRQTLHSRRPTSHDSIG